MKRSNKSKWKHGFSYTDLHYVWIAMKQRCTNPKNPNYHKYGARGIRVCANWTNDFMAFYADMGVAYRKGLSIERKNNNGGYWCGHCVECRVNKQPANCCWATAKEQAANTRRNINLTFLGKTQHLKAWAQEVGLDYGTLRNRIRKGWSLEKALTAPASQSDYVYNIRLIEYQGRTQNITAWANEMNINPKALMSRIERGWTVERALTQPVRAW